MYINEIIRVTYKCNWKCKFCNVLKTNNFWQHDMSDSELVYNILNLVKKYSEEERKYLSLSFSWWEPLLNKNITNYIKLAKKIWIWTIELQTNGVFLYKNKNFIYTLKDAWLDIIFIAQHWFYENENNLLWCILDKNSFEEWIKFLIDNKIYNEIQITLNIVVNKINLFSLLKYIDYLFQIWFVSMLKLDENNWFDNTKRISFWLIQPNGYAFINKEEVLLDFNDAQVWEIKKIIKHCFEYNIYPDFHFTAPPLCVLNIPLYNLEYSRLKLLEKDRNEDKIVSSNLEVYKNLWKEKKKFNICKKCINNNYCLGFYKNWIKFVWEKYVKEKIKNFIDNVS
jgi:MoaA/NifB/PqqE/SkfB family radical SAM enzyme